MSDRTTFARHLRSRQTSAEEALWRLLRWRRMSGFKFRRQVPIGPHIVDFFCFDAKLILEVDGSQHESARIYDARRTVELERQGFTVVRVTNQMVRERLDDCVALILAALRWSERAPPEGAPPSPG